MRFFFKLWRSPNELENCATRYSGKPLNRENWLTVNERYVVMSRDAFQVSVEWSQSMDVLRADIISSFQCIL